MGAASAFATARTALFSNPDGSEAGTFLPNAGGSYPCRVIFSNPDKPGDVGPVQFRNPGTRIGLYIPSYTARPIAGIPSEADRVLVGATTYYLRDVAANPRGLYFDCDADPV